MIGWSGDLSLNIRRHGYKVSARLPCVTNYVEILSPHMLVSNFFSFLFFLFFFFGRGKVGYLNWLWQKLAGSLGLSLSFPGLEM